jgi:hypothetical protein
MRREGNEGLEAMTTPQGPMTDTSTTSIEMSEDERFLRGIAESAKVGHPDRQESFERICDKLEANAKAARELGSHFNHRFPDGCEQCAELCGILGMW